MRRRGSPRKRLTICHLSLPPACALLRPGLSRRPGRSKLFTQCVFSLCILLAACSRRAPRRCAFPFPPDATQAHELRPKLYAGSLVDPLPLEATKAKCVNSRGGCRFEHRCGSMCIAACIPEKHPDTSPFLCVVAFVSAGLRACGSTLSGRGRSSRSRCSRFTSPRSVRLSLPSRPVRHLRSFALSFHLCHIRS